MPTPPSRAPWTLVVVCSAIFMLTLDVTIVSVALAGIQDELTASLSSLQWVVDGYTLPLACGLLSAAVLGDRIGRRRVFVAGLFVFTAASLACALAGSAATLIAARAVQGGGAALLFGTALPLLGAAYPEPAQRARAVGVFGASYAAATAAGPLIGGVLVDGPGWRWIFLINVPIGLLAVAGCLRLRESRPDRAPRNDWTGAALLSGGLLALLTALIRGNDDGWASGPILGLCTASAVLLVAFVGWERRTADPMLSLRLLVRPAFAGVALQSFATAATLVAATYYLALHLQNVAGYSPLETGLRVLPLTATALVAAPVAAALLRRFGATPLLVLGLVLAGAGLLAASLIDESGSMAVLAPGFVLAGAGLGVGAAATASAGLAAVEPADAGMATGTVNTMRQIGTAAGVAVLGAVVQFQAKQNAQPLLDTVSQPLPKDRLIAEIGAGLGRHTGRYLPAGVRETAAEIARSATNDAVSTVFLISGAAALAAAVACGLLLTRRPAPLPVPVSISADLNS
ncbi:drug resistance transporter, EmrB/QacA subfamily [Actinoplanes philippinensis]|uniref:Drug resistance transporter, EmrB/QacA subfamily n=2 Tax=Actinoplanes philippinensis TaxID=35752 RepID=A0A1I2G3K0_9ACTN|nr:MFS transporter [Actinoplanes philippinensis]SFF11738.1 drug resistance transporter, EmrB/QacA subfamily [Actinoplanes philippinensis]